MTKIKICGLSRLCDIEAVNEEKPDFIGFVFAESRRRVTPQQAMKLREKLHTEIAAVGVFVNERKENIINLITNGIIDSIQLHGVEDEEYIRKLKLLTDKAIIKAITVQNTGDVQRWNDTSADFLLLDNHGGGTGKLFDWELIGEAGKPYFLAGGLCPENVREAIRKTTPFAVDASSGVENGGLKDPVKIREFIRRVRNEY
ncbi:MAG: phosphoribosylanthranilate isomerase [Acidobacteriota bacterium]|nr:phosphoribosylanthranilate isomerase [Acidobacteriota bacterium]